MRRIFSNPSSSGSSSNSSSGSSMSLPACALLWLLCACVLALGSHGQRQGRETTEAPAAGGKSPAHLAERDVICHAEGCYAVFVQKRTFREAGRSCRERGGTLATVHEERAAAAVHELLSSVEPQGGRARLRLWIGLHRPPRQCSATRPLRGFVWVTGDQDGQYTNWLRDEAPGACAAPRCVAMTVLTSESTRESSDNFRWLDGSCGLALDGYVCQYNYKGMCRALDDEGAGPAVYTTPFHLVSTLLTHVPFGSVGAVPCPALDDDSDGDSPLPDDPETDPAGEETVLCMEREDGTVGWSRDGPLCSAPDLMEGQDWCGADHGCEQHCQSTDTDYYCYCDEGFVLDEDRYSCRPDPLEPEETEAPPPDDDASAASTTDQPHRISRACVAAGCEYDCVETPRGVRCTCPPGYQVGPDGRGCSDVDECRQRPCAQLCVNAPGTFHCACHAGYQPDDEGECADVDECLDEGSCEGGGPCENTPGSFACLCAPGYERAAGGECVDVDECAGDDSPCQQHCLNFMGGYQCYCDTGYDPQPDGLSCEPSPASEEDEEYSTLSTDGAVDPNGHSLHPGRDPYARPNSDSDAGDRHHDLPWPFTPDPNFEVDPDFDPEWLTRRPDELLETTQPPPPHDGSDDHLNQWDAPLSPTLRHHAVTAPPPPVRDRSDNEAEFKAGGGGGAAAGGSDTANVGRAAESAGAAEDINGAGSATSGKRKHDKSWLLVALLVPLCVFVVVMLALGIVYCTSCAVDKSKSFSDCYRWILPPATPPEGRDGKPRA